LLNRKIRQKLAKGRKQLIVFYFSLLVAVNITLFFCIGLLPNIHNKRSIKKSKDISLEEKLHILSLAQFGIKNSEIALKVGRSICSIQRVIKAQKGLAENTPPPPLVKRSGRPRKITKSMMEMLRLFVSCSPFKTGREIKQELYGFGDISV
jgi:hypothetical protein